MQGADLNLPGNVDFAVCRCAGILPGRERPPRFSLAPLITLLLFPATLLADDRTPIDLHFFRGGEGREFF